MLRCWKLNSSGPYSDGFPPAMPATPHQGVPAVTSVIKSIVRGIRATPLAEALGPLWWGRPIARETTAIFLAARKRSGEALWSDAKTSHGGVHSMCQCKDKEGDFADNIASRHSSGRGLSFCPLATAVAPIDPIPYARRKVRAKRYGVIQLTDRFQRRPHRTGPCEEKPVYRRRGEREAICPNRDHAGVQANP